MSSNNSKQLFGIHELYRPRGRVAQVDIVAVHGLEGDAIKSWSSKSGVCWLSHPDFLPKHIPEARVVTWGYNANVSNLKGKTTSADRILQHAQSFVAELYADRQLEDAIERPIIFLCHSLGGIILKRALAYATSRQAPNVSFLQSIYTCTYGILFFGTPHHGSSKANLLSTMHKLASLSIPNCLIQTESRLVDALREDSEILQDINDQFCPLISRFRIFFFWEQEKTEIKVLKKADYIVTEASAAPILVDAERCGIAANHGEMCKFDNPNGQGFRTVIAALHRYTRHAPGVVTARVAQGKEMLLQKRRDEAMEILGYSLGISSCVTQHITQNGIDVEPEASIQRSTTVNGGSRGWVVSDPRTSQNLESLPTEEGTYSGQKYVYY